MFGSSKPRIFSCLNGGDFLEIGAGSGAFARDILSYFEKAQCLPQHYYILELTAARQQEQQDCLQQALPAEIYRRVVWLTQLPQKPFSGVIFANEVIDALPVTRFKKTASGVKEAYVDVSDDELVLQWREPQEKALLTLETDLGIVFDPGYCSERHALLPGWLKSLSDALTQGVILFIDYGYARREYYHIERSMGTLMCHYRHHAHDNPLIRIGVQDITAHVDFTAVAEAASDAGCDVEGFLPQASFLINLGLLSGENLDPLKSSEQMHFKRMQAIKQLIFPGQMGEAFKVMGLSKNYEAPLSGFSEGNCLAEL